MTTAADETASAETASAKDKNPLAGLVVIDLGQIYAAPYATLLLALGGATVIKVEPVHGEHLRVRGQVGGPRYAFANLHSNKSCITLNLKDDRGKRLLEQLVAKADVLVENFRPGVMERLGVGADVLRAVNPRLVYAQSSGFGRSGPYREYPAMDLSVQAISGVLGITGFPDGPPVKSGPAICDFFGGIHLYGGILTALYRRERTGEGATVEISMHEAVYASMMSNLGHFFSSGVDDFRSGNRHGGYSVVPYNVYAAKDGHVGIICESDGHWRKLLAVMGRDDLVDDPRYTETKNRVEHIDAIDALVGAWVATQDKEEVFSALRAVGVPSAPVRSLSQVTTDPHHFARGMLQEIEHPTLGPITVPHSPILLEDVGREAPRPSRGLGEDNRSVYCDWLGMAPEHLDELVEEGVV